MLVTKAKINPDGRLLIPAEFRKALGLETGTSVILTMEEGGLRLTTREHNIQLAQQAVRRHVPEGQSLVDGLLAERRREASETERGV